MWVGFTWCSWIVTDPFCILERGRVKTADEVRDQLEFLQSKLDCCLVIDGESLQVRIPAMSG